MWSCYSKCIRKVHELYTQKNIFTHYKVSDTFISKGGKCMERKKIKAARSLTVVKQNDIVQKARYRLDLVQQTAIMYLISKINSMKDVEFQEIEIDIKDLCEIMGVKYNGKNLKDFKDNIQKLSDKSIWVDTGDKIRLMRWLQRVDIDKGTTTVTVKFDEQIGRAHV